METYMEQSLGTELLYLSIHCDESYSVTSSYCGGMYFSLMWVAFGVAQWIY